MVDNYYLLLDCDGVIFNSNPLIDNYVQRIEYKASDRYGMELDLESQRAHDEYHKWQYERSNDLEKLKKIRERIEEIGNRRREHFLLKDQVLEEVYPEYENRIDYDRIYQMRNTFPGIIKKIIDIWESGVYNKIFIVTHSNSPREVMAKMRFFRKYLPMVELVFVKFHDEKFYYNPEEFEKNYLRRRTNKIEAFIKTTGIQDLSNSSFMDDTGSIVTEADELGVGYTYYKSEEEDSVEKLEGIFADTVIAKNKMLKKSYKIGRK